MTSKIDEAQEALNTAAIAVADATAALDAAEDEYVSIEESAGKLGQYALTPLREVTNYDLVYLPNITSLGASSKRFRFITSFDGHINLLRNNLLYATADEAKQAAQAMIDILGAK